MSGRVRWPDFEVVLNVVEADGKAGEEAFLAWQTHAGREEHGSFMRWFG
jgi:hypothetical protein